MSRLPQAPTLCSLFIPAAVYVLLVQPARLTAQATEPEGVQASLSSLPEAPQPQMSSSAAPDETDKVPATTSQQQQQETRQTLPKPNGQSQQAPPPPSLGDLGLSPSQTKPDPDLQARLDRHTRMLRIHQRLGIIALAPLAGARISSCAAPPSKHEANGNTVGRDIHLAFGASAVTMYAITASYVRPKSPRGPRVAASVAQISDLCPRARHACFLSCFSA